MALLFSITHLTRNVKYDKQNPPHWKGAFMPPVKGNFQIIGNTDYNDIYDKFYLHLSTDKAEKIAERLTEREIPFSGKVMGEKTTITIDYEDLEYYKQAVSDVEFAELSPKEQIFATMRKLYIEHQQAEDEYYRTEFLSDYALAEYKSWGDETPEDEEMARAKEAVMQKWRERTIEFFNASDKLDSIEDAIVLLYEDYLMLEQEQTADLSAQIGTTGRKAENMENKQALYSIERGDDIRHYKAAGEYSIDDLLNVANDKNPYLKLMDMGEQISIGKYAEIQQSDRFTFSIEMNFDTLSGTIYEVNDGKGGIAEEDRTDDNIRFTSGKLSELREKIADLSAQRGERETSMMTSVQDISTQDKTFAYEFGHSFPFTVVHLDISTEERKNAVSNALNNVIHNIYGERNDMSQPYKNLLENIQPERNYISAFEGHLLCLKHALEQSKFDKNKSLCMEMLHSVRHAEDTSRCGRIEIKGENCRQTDAWEEHGVTCVIGQSIHDNDFYYVRATDERIARDFEFDHEPSHEEVISKYTDLLSEEYMDRYEAEHGADGYGATTSEHTESKQALYSMEQGDDMRYYKAAKEYSIEDILNAANNRIPYLALMDMGEKITIGEYAEIQQSDRFSFSVEMNFDTLSAKIYEVNDGKGGIAEENRTDDNIRFTSGKLSELREKFADLSVQRSTQDKTYAYEYGRSDPFTIVMLDISTVERKEAVSAALNNVILNIHGEKSDMSRPYKNLLAHTKSTSKRQFLCAYERHLNCLKYALKNAPVDKELCASMLDNIERSEKNLTPVMTINGYECVQKDSWKDHDVTFIIGQSINATEFYYARATDGKTTRDYEYDYEPSRARVMSDHADKLSEEYMDRYEAEHGADGYGAFSAPESQERAENIRQMQDISHNFNNADPSAKRGERKDTMNTKFEVTSITTFDDDTARKALASVAVNSELIVSGISVRENENGELYVQMPRQKNGVDEQGKAKYEDRVFPVTAEAREAMNNAVLGAYENLKAQGLENSFVKVEPPEKSTSRLNVSLFKTDNEKSAVKARGQIVIDDCFVIKGVSVSERTNSKTKENFFSVDLPLFKQNDKGDYPPVVKPITAEFREKLNKAVMNSFNTQTRGVTFSALGGKENVATYFRQNNQFAEKLMNQLESKGIDYHAKIAATTTISVKLTDKAAVEDIKKEIANEGRKPSIIGEVGKIKAEQKAQEAEKPAPQKAKSNGQEL